MLRMIRGSKNSRKLTATKAVMLLLAVDALLFGLWPSSHYVEAAIAKKSSRSTSKKAAKLATLKKPAAARPVLESADVIPGVVNEDSNEVLSAHSELESRGRIVPRKSRVVIKQASVQTPAPEAIAATESDEETDEVLPDPLSEAPSEVAAREERDQREAALPSKPMMVAQNEIKSPIENYDLVPKTQIDRILPRLKIVEGILEKYGRAYDYKEYTLNQLKEIESQLERVYGNSQTTDF